MVESEFDVEDGFVDHGVPTFYVRMREDSKEAFLRLVERLRNMGFVPVLRKREEKPVLRVISKPPVKPSRRNINLVLFLATMTTMLLAGYYNEIQLAGSLKSLELAELIPELTPNPLISAAMFTVAIAVILGAHEGAHILATKKHKIEATYPYFIPGPPPIGTFGAVIQQKSLSPNRDALFDTGISGPIMGFIVAAIVTIIGIQISPVVQISDQGKLLKLTEGGLPWPFLFEFLFEIFQPNGTGNVIFLHPIVFAGWVGMVITMLNLVPVGMFDGGHVVRSLVGERVHQIISYLGIALMFFISYPMAFLALIFAFQRHPGPLDEVSEPTTLRKLAALGLIAIFILCVVPIFPLL